MDAARRSLSNHRAGLLQTSFFLGEFLLLLEDSLLV